MGPHRGPQSRAGQPLRILWLIGGLTVLAFAFGASLAIWQLRRHEVREAERTLITIDYLLRDQTERALQSVDLILQNVHEKILADGVKTAADFERIEGGTETRDILRMRTGGVPQLDAVTLISAEGRLINFSRPMDLPQVNVSDRTYFKQLRDDPTRTSLLSEPLQNRGDGRWNVYLARRIDGPHGEFVGLILGAIDLAYFENLYRILQVGEGGAVSLWRSDSMLLARYPRIERVGQLVPIRSFTGILRGDQPVTYQTPASIDGYPRIVATSASSRFPIVINVTETLDQVLDDWRHFATFIVFGALLCILATVAIVTLIARRFSTYEALGRALAEREAAVVARDLAEEQARQAQKLEAVGQLTGGIAHDFNNLLTAVLGNIELLKRHAGEEDPRLKRWAQNAYDSAQRGATLTQRLLAFSRRQPLDPRAADVGDVVTAMTDLLRRTLGENIEVVTAMQPQLWPAFIDVNQLDSAILNIAINARDAMGGRGTLTVAAANVPLDAGYAEQNADVTAGDYVEIAVSDTGDGIDAATLERVFEPFFTTKPIGQGTGLGLSQVYGFVKQSGGHIKIYSEVGQGTTVRMYLPRAAPDQTRYAPPVAASAVPAGRAMRILVVEDDRDVRRFSVEILRDLGHGVHEAGDGPAALDMLARLPDVDVLFTDVGLPGMNGRELADRALAAHPTLRVLFTTGYTRNAIVHHGRLDAGVELISKPFTRADLADKIQAMAAELAAG